jgi:arylsulfatase A-like enzyme
MTAAQKTAKANFKKAIEYRKKTGVSLKEAFAHVYGKKVGAAPKKKAAKKAAPKKAAKKVVKKAAPKKAAKKKHTKYGKVKAHTRRVAGVHKDTKSHNVNIRVVSGMGSPIEDLNYLLREKKKAVENFEVAKANRNRKGDTKEVKEHYNYWYNRYNDYIKNLDKRIAIAKKHIK